jgi:hypothetical protein
MKKKLKILVSSVVTAITFSLPPLILGMEDLSEFKEQKSPSGIQLEKSELEKIKEWRKELKPNDLYCKEFYKILESIRKFYNTEKTTQVGVPLVLSEQEEKLLELVKTEITTLEKGGKTNWLDPNSRKKVCGSKHNPNSVGGKKKTEIRQALKEVQEAIKIH